MFGIISSVNKHDVSNHAGLVVHSDLWCMSLYFYLRPFSVNCIINEQLIKTKSHIDSLKTWSSSSKHAHITVLEINNSMCEARYWNLCILCIIINKVPSILFEVKNSHITVKLLREAAKNVHWAAYITTSCTFSSMWNASFDLFMLPKTLHD